MGRLWPLDESGSERAGLHHRDMFPLLRTSMILSDGSSLNYALRAEEALIRRLLNFSLTKQLIREPTDLKVSRAREIYKYHKK